MLGLLNIHGMIVECDCASSTLLYELLRPYKYFRVETGTPQHRVRVLEGDVPYSEFPQIPAAFSTPRNIVYEDDDHKIIDYFGKGAVLQDGSSFTIYSPDRNLLLESFYLLVLSLLGTYCDERGLLRVHALGVSLQDTAILVLLPQGGGKSTLAHALLEFDAIRYISDDDPIVARDGAILAFPRPLGALQRESLNAIPDEFIYHVDRMEFGRKYYVDSDHWNGKLEKRQLRKVAIVLGKRVMNGKPEIRETSRRRVLRSLIRDAVVGVGLYQGLEFLLSRSSWSLFSKVPVVFRRFSRAYRLARSARPYEMELGPVPAENARVLKEFFSNGTSS